MRKDVAYAHRRLGGRKGRMRLAHHVVWEEKYGPIPEGYELHHLDEDKKNNHILNLRLVTRREHQRMHSPHYCLVDGEWRIVCRRCKEAKTLDKFSTHGASRATTCKPCRAEAARIDRSTSSEQD